MTRPIAVARIRYFLIPNIKNFSSMTNSVMMPISALMTCALVVRVIGLGKLSDEVTKEGTAFKRKPVFDFTVRYLSPIFLVIILLSSIAAAMGLITF